MKGLKLEPGQIVVLALDGTMVYVDKVQPNLCVEVIALPEQPTERADDRVFTPGRVGAKKISPFSEADKVIAVADLSERNRAFIGTFEALRAQHGPNYVDRTPEEQAAWDLKANPPDKKAVRSQAKADRAAAKAAKKTADGPRRLQRCVTCGEQPGHPNHPAVHEFLAPAPPMVRCAACGEEESANVHGEQGGPIQVHKFIPETALKAARTPRAAKAVEPDDATPKAPKERKERAPKTSLPQGKHRWVPDDARLKMLCAVNGKYNDGNSGAAIIAAIVAAGDAGAEPGDVCAAMAAHPRWAGVPIERVQLAFQQLLGAQLIEAVK